MGPYLIWQISIFTTHAYAYIIHDIHINNIRIHSYLVVDINKEKNTKYVYQIETSGNSDRQILIM